MSYIIGLDLGINNVGWSIVDANTNEIKLCGVRKFSASAGASDRRVQRNTRRRLKRKDTRKDDALRLLKSIGLPDTNTVDTKLIETRVKGIHEKLDSQEITNIICFMMTHRGYIPFGDEEVEFVDLGGKLPCEYYYDLFKNSKDSKYRALRKTVKNSENEEELRRMLTEQSKYYTEITNEFIENIISLFKRKRAFWEGPGSVNSLTPYGRFKTTDDVEDYIGKKESNTSYEKYLFEDLISRCEVEPEEVCASKANFYAEKFNLINDFTNLSFSNVDDAKREYFQQAKDKTYKLTSKGIEEIFNYCINHDNVNLNKMVKDLFNSTWDNISGYKQKGDKPEMCTMDVYRSIKKKFKDCDLKIFDDISEENINIYNSIIHYMSLVPGFVELVNMLAGDGITLSEKDITALKDSFKTNKAKAHEHHSLSEKVLKRAINDMLSLNLNYMQVSRINNYEQTAREYFNKRYEEYSKNSKFIYMNPSFVDDIIASAQVKKTLRQAIKIINAIVDQEGEFPEVIAIESTTEMNGKDKKEEYQRINRINLKLHDEAVKTLNSIKADVTPKNIRKVMLYEEFDGHCAYCSKPIDLKKFIDGSDELEHILPRSASLDNSYENRTVSCPTCNSKKGNKTPYQFLSKTEYESFKERIKSNKKISEFKKANFLYEGDINKYKNRFVNRNLRDTAYATSELVRQVNIYNSYLKSKDASFEGIKTLSSPGQLTGAIRKKCKIEKDRDAGDVPYHHAVDASIVALLPTTNLGKNMVEFQNDRKFFINPNSDQNTNEINNEMWEYIKDNGKHVEFEKYYKDLNSIDDYSPNFRYSGEISKDTNKQLFKANVIKAIKTDKGYMQIRQINNIYDKSVDRKLLDKLFDDTKNETLLCHDNNIEFYNKLKDIYRRFKDRDISPFEAYCREINGLSDEDKFERLDHGIKMADNGPVVTKLKYYMPINDPYLIESKKLNMKDNTYLAYDGIAQVYTKVYHNITKNCFAFLPIPAICIDSKTKKVNEEHKLYKFYKNKLLGEDEVEHIVDLYNGNMIEVTKPDGEVIKDEVSSYHKTNDKITLKKGKYFTKSDKKLVVYDYNILGKCYKRLTFEIK